MAAASPHRSDIMDVAIVGAGPAGVLIGTDLTEASNAAVAAVCMVDPTYGGGDLSRKFLNVPGNTAAGTYLGALTRYLDGSDRPTFSIEGLPDSETCPISDLTPPIRWLSERLLARPQVERQPGFVHEARLLENGLWQLSDDSDHPWSVLSRTVVLTTGGRPKELDGLDVSDRSRAKVVHLRKALDGGAVSEVINDQDSVVIIGSSHSGILALMHLMQLPPDQQPQSVTVYHRSPIRVSSKAEKVTYYDNTGLKGVPKAWAGKNLVNDSDGSVRYVGGGSTRTTVRFAHLTESDDLAALIEADETCTKIVDARGLLPRELPRIWTPGSEQSYTTAQIARFGEVDSAAFPGLFAAGVLAPEIVQEKTLHDEVLFAGNVGVTKFAKTSGVVASDVIARLEAA